MAKVTGIGGVFFKSANKGSELAAWYEKNLGLDLEDWGGSILRWPDDKAEDGGLTVWNAADNDTKWFSPSESSFMINYRVEDLEGLVEQLKKEGVTITDKIETFEYGKFVHILDIEGNKIELWEPKDNEYDKIVDGRTK